MSGSNLEETGVLVGIAATVGGGLLWAGRHVLRWWRAFWGRFALASDVNRLDAAINRVDKATQDEVESLRTDLTGRMERHEQATAGALSAIVGEIDDLREKMPTKDDLEHVRRQVDRLVDHALGQKTGRQ